MKWFHNTEFIPAQVLTEIIREVFSYLFYIINKIFFYLHTLEYKG